MLALSPQLLAFQWMEGPKLNLALKCCCLQHHIARNTEIIKRIG